MERRNGGPAGPVGAARPAVEHRGSAACGFTGALRAWHCRAAAMATYVVPFSCLQDASEQFQHIATLYIRCMPPHQPQWRASHAREGTASSLPALLWPTDICKCSGSLRRATTRWSTRRNGWISGRCAPTHAHSCATGENRSRSSDLVLRARPARTHCRAVW